MYDSLSASQLDKFATFLLNSQNVSWSDLKHKFETALAAQLGGSGEETKDEMAYGDHVYVSRDQALRAASQGCSSLFERLAVVSQHRLTRDTDLAWAKKMSMEGVLKDKFSAFATLLTAQPIFSLKSCLKEGLMASAKRQNRTEKLDALRTLRNLFEETHLIPDDRPLVTFTTSIMSNDCLLNTLIQPVTSNEGVREERVTDEGARGYRLVKLEQDSLLVRYLLLCRFEDDLKTEVAEYVSVLSGLASDSVDYVRREALYCAQSLLKFKPEQDAANLTLLVRCLGDTATIVASAASQLLAEVLLAHPQMKEVVCRKVEELIWMQKVNKKALAQRENKQKSVLQLRKHRKIKLRAREARAGGSPESLKGSTTVGGGVKAEAEQDDDDEGEEEDDEAEEGEGEGEELKSEGKKTEKDDKTRVKTELDGAEIEVDNDGSTTSNPSDTDTKTSLLTTSTSSRLEPARAEEGKRAALSYAKAHHAVSAAAHFLAEIRYNPASDPKNFVPSQIRRYVRILSVLLDRNIESPSALNQTQTTAGGLPLSEKRYTFARGLAHTEAGHNVVKLILAGICRLIPFCTKKLLTTTIAGSRYSQANDSHGADASVGSTGSTVVKSESAATTELDGFADDTLGDLPAGSETPASSGGPVKQCKDEAEAEGEGEGEGEGEAGKRPKRSKRKLLAKRAAKAELKSGKDKRKVKLEVGAPGTTGTSARSPCAISELSRELLKLTHSVPNKTVCVQGWKLLYDLHKNVELLTPTILANLYAQVRVFDFFESSARATWVSLLTQVIGDEKLVPESVRAAFLRRLLAVVSQCDFPASFTLLVFDLLERAAKSLQPWIEAGNVSESAVSKGESKAKSSKGASNLSSTADADEDQPQYNAAEFNPAQAQALSVSLFEAHLAGTSIFPIVRDSLAAFRVGLRSLDAAGAEGDKDSDFFDEEGFLMPSEASAVMVVGNWDELASLEDTDNVRERQQRLHKARVAMEHACSLQTLAALMHGVSLRTALALSAYRKRSDQPPGQGGRSGPKTEDEDRGEADEELAKELCDRKVNTESFWTGLEKDELNFPFKNLFASYFVDRDRFASERLDDDDFEALVDAQADSWLDKLDNDIAGKDVDMEGDDGDSDEDSAGDSEDGVRGDGDSDGDEGGLGDDVEAGEEIAGSIADGLADVILDGMSEDEGDGEDDDFSDGLARAYADSEDDGGNEIENEIESPEDTDTTELAAPARKSKGRKAKASPFCDADEYEAKTKLLNEAPSIAREGGSQPRRKGAMGTKGGEVHRSSVQTMKSQKSHRSQLSLKGTKYRR